MSILWTCKCGYKEFLHRELCSRCAEPAPPREECEPVNTQFGVKRKTPAEPPKPPEPKNDPGHYGYYS